MNHFINFNDFTPDYLENIIDQALEIAIIENVQRADLKFRMRAATSPARRISSWPG